MARISATALQRALAEGRRDATRYDVRLPLRYSIVNLGGVTVNGTGESLNVSRTGLLLRADRTLQIGDSVVAVLDWPIPAPDNEPLKLVISGHVVRTKRHLAAIALHTHRLLRDQELKKRFRHVLGGWGTALLKTPPAPAPMVVIEEDDTVASLVSNILTTRNWRIEQADVERVEALLRRGDAPISLLVTRTRSLLELLPPHIAGILTIDEGAPPNEAADLASLPTRVVVRKPLREDSLRALIDWVLGTLSLGMSGTKTGATS